MSVERCVREEENILGFYVGKSEKNLIKSVGAAEASNTENTVTSGEFKKQKAQELKQNWHESKMHVQFTREMSKKLNEDRTWQWLSKSDLKIGTETLLCAAQEEVIRKTYVRHHNYKTSESPLCRLCGGKGESALSQWM